MDCCEDEMCKNGNELGQYLTYRECQSIVSIAIVTIKNPQASRTTGGSLPGWCVVHSY